MFIVWFVYGVDLLLSLLCLGAAMVVGRDSALLDDPPEHLSSEREAKVGLLTLAAGVLFLLLGLAATMGSEEEGLVFLPSAALVVAGWGTGRILIVAMGTRQPVSWLVAAGLLGLLTASTASALAHAILN